MASSWNIDNIGGHLEDYVWRSFINHNLAGGVMVGMLLINLSYIFVNKIYVHRSTEYKEQLTRGQQLIVIHHTVEAAFLGIIYIPFTYVMLSIFFEEQSLESLGDKVTVAGVCDVCIVLMYLVELSSRFSHPRPLVVAHHLCAWTAGTFALFFPSTANVKTVSLFIYFVTYESVTFLGLLMYRLAPSHKLTRPTILAGMLIFGLSRPVQVVWILGSLIAGWDDLILWHAIIQIILTIGFTSLQLFTLTIHWKLYQKCGHSAKTTKEGFAAGNSQELMEITEGGLSDPEREIDGIRLDDEEVDGIMLDDADEECLA